MAIYPIPDIYKPIAGVARPYERGTWVGLTDATRAEIAARSTVVDVLSAISGSTKRVAGHMDGRTTATLTSGSNTITVADGSQWQVGYGLVLGMVAKIRVTGGATADGDLTWVLHFQEYPIAVVAGDTTAQVAAKISAAPWRGTTSAPVDNGDGSFTITFRSPTVENFLSGVGFDIKANATGVTFANKPAESSGTDRVEIPWAGNFYEVASVSGNTIGLTPRSQHYSIPGDVSYSGSDVIVRHNDGPAIQDHIAALASGSVLSFASTAECEIHQQWSINRSNITVRGNGSYQENWGGAASPSVGGSDYHTNQTLAVGGKTLGSQTLEVIDSAGYSANDIVLLRWENDLTLPVLSGFDTNEKEQRGPMQMLVRITSVPDSTHIAIDRPLPFNLSGLYMLVSSPMSGFITKTSFEGFVIESLNSRVAHQGGMYATYECLWDGIKVSNGSSFMCSMGMSLRGEWRRVYLDRIPGYSTNKFGMGWNGSTGCLLEDSILYNIVNLIQGGSGLIWSAASMCALVVSTDGSSLANCHFNFNHQAHPAFVCAEGCWIQSGVGFEGYHGGTSNHIVLRNHLGAVNGEPSEYGVSVDIRAKVRHIALLGNQFQDSGFVGWINDGIQSSGYPNYNSNTNGGTSINNDWPDLQKILNPATASLAAGVITTTTDYFLPRHGLDGGGNVAWVVTADRQHRYAIGAYIDARNVAVFAAEGTPPTSFTDLPVATWPVSGENGYQEQDLQVAATLLRVGNTSAFSNGMPEIDSDNLGSDELPDSLIYASRPAWLDDAEDELDLTFEWPPFGPRTGNLNHRNESISAIPAGARFVATIPPQFISATINAAGTTVTLSFNKAVQFGAGGNGGLTLFNGVGDLTASYVSGSGSTNLVYSLSRVVMELEIEQPRLNYAQPGLGIVDALGNELESLSNRSISNGSNQLGSVVEYLSALVEDATEDYAQVQYSGLLQEVVVSQPCTVNKLRLYTGDFPGASGVAMALFSVAAVPATKIAEGSGSITGADRWLSVNVEPVHLDAGTYLVGIRIGTDDVQNRMRALTDNGNTGHTTFASQVNNYWSEFTSFSAPTGAGTGKTIVCGIRVILDVDPPAAPTGLTATAVSPTQVNLAWTDESDDETGFKVERAIGEGAFSVIHTTAADAESYNVTGLTPNTAYRWRVKATNSGGDSTPSNEEEEATPPDTAIPTLRSARARRYAIPRQA